MKQCVIVARRTERRLLAALAVAVAAMAPSARAELVNIVWDASGHFESEAKVAPGKFAEVCGPLAKGQTVAWSFKADRPMNFNVHYHVGEQVVFPLDPQFYVLIRGPGRLRGGVPHTNYSLKHLESLGVL